LSVPVGVSITKVPLRFRPSGYSPGLVGTVRITWPPLGENILQASLDGSPYRFTHSSSSSEKKASVSALTTVQGWPPTLPVSLPSAIELDPLPPSSPSPPQPLRVNANSTVRKRARMAAA
jgi:hypothetical protein